MSFTRRAYIIAANEMARPPLLFWLEDHGFNRRSDIAFIHESRDVCMAWSAAIRKALEDRVDMAVFCENDAIPSAAATDQFFTENRYHLQCVKYDTENSHAFNRYDSFHTLIWRASRESLLKLAERASLEKSPICKWTYGPAGDVISECACSSIAKLAKNAGLSTGWIGNAGHAPKPSSIVPRIVRYAP